MANKKKKKRSLFANLGRSVDYFFFFFSSFFSIPIDTLFICPCALTWFCCLITPHYVKNSSISLRLHYLLRRILHPWHAPTQVDIIKKVNKVQIWNFRQFKPDKLPIRYISKIAYKSKLTYRGTSLKCRNTWVMFIIKKRSHETDCKWHTKIFAFISKFK